MNAPPATLMDELDRLMQAAWTERIPNRRYARIDPVTTAATPTGSFAGELFEESQPLPITGTKAPTLASALAEPRHRALLLLDLYATALVIAAIGMSLVFVRNFDVGAPWQREPLLARRHVGDPGVRRRVLLPGVGAAVGPLQLRIGADLGRDDRQLADLAHRHRQQLHQPRQHREQTSSAPRR